MPRTSSQSASSQLSVFGSAKQNGMVAAAMMANPTMATGRPPILSVSRPTRPRMSRAPMPWGMSMMPALSGVAPRASW